MEQIKNQMEMYLISKAVLTLALDHLLRYYPIAPKKKQI